MNRTPVSSSNLRSVGYDSATQVLEIEFKSGDIYQWFAVPNAVYDELMHSPSIGGYYSKHIRGNYKPEESLSNYKRRE